MAISNMFKLYVDNLLYVQKVCGFCLQCWVNSAYSKNGTPPFHTHTHTAWITAYLELRTLANVFSNNPKCGSTNPKAMNRPANHHASAGYSRMETLPRINTRYKSSMHSYFDLVIRAACTDIMTLYRIAGEFYYYMMKIVVLFPVVSIVHVVSQIQILDI